MVKETLNKALRIKAKYKSFSVEKPCFIEVNYTILTLKTAPINTSAVEALCYCWNRIPEQKHWIQVVISTSQDTSWYVTMKVTRLQLDYLTVWRRSTHCCCVYYEKLRMCDCSLIDHYGRFHRKLILSCWGYDWRTNSGSTIFFGV